jgi:hypothetical protein
VLAATKLLYTLDFTLDSVGNLRYLGLNRISPDITWTSSTWWRQKDAFNQVQRMQPCMVLLAEGPDDHKRVRHWSLRKQEYSGRDSRLDVNLHKQWRQGWLIYVY